MSNAECAGTWQPVIGRVRVRTGSVWQRRYGVGYCAVCGKRVTCHKGGGAVTHKPDGVRA